MHSCGGDKGKEEREPAYKLFSIGACSACTTSILPLPVIVKDTGIPSTMSLIKSSSRFLNLSLVFPEKNYKLFVIKI